MDPLGFARSSNLPPQKGSRNSPFLWWWGGVRHGSISKHIWCFPLPSTALSSFDFLQPLGKGGALAAGPMLLLDSITPAAQGTFGTSFLSYCVWPVLTAAPWSRAQLALGCS